MTEPIFDHERLDVYRLSIQYVTSAFDVSKMLNGMHRHARDQWLRAAQSIPLNIIERRVEGVIETNCIDADSLGDEI